MGSEMSAGGEDSFTMSIHQKPSVEPPTPIPEFETPKVSHFSHYNKPLQSIEQDIAGVLGTHQNLPRSHHQPRIHSELSQATRLSAIVRDPIDAIKDAYIDPSRRTIQCVTHEDVVVSEFPNLTQVPTKIHSRISMGGDQRHNEDIRNSLPPNTGQPF